MPKYLKPPELVRGLTALDKTLFEKLLHVCYLNLKDINLAKVIPLLKQHLLKMEKFKPVETVNPNEVNVYLNPDTINSWENLPEETVNSLRNFSVDENSFKRKELTVNYDNYPAADVLKAVLPEETEGSSSFTKTGHIVHVNLREHLLPYKNIISKVLFDKVQGCRTVVNKLDMIDNTYRNFQMEVLQGEDDMITTVKENRCTFRMDFSTVYWNSRLCTEHERIVEKLQPNDVLFDVFAGIGPFSVPAAKKKCFVYANDLNPESFKWLNHNSKTNKIDMKFFTSSNKDGRDFILNDIKKYLPKYLNKHNIYITMNLPALAVEFLSAFVGLYDEKELEVITNPPTVFVYCFAKGLDYENIAKDLVIKSIGCDISDKITEIFRVRTVSSLKEMMRVSFKLDKDILVARDDYKRKQGDDKDLRKRIKCGDGEEEKN